MQAQEVSNSTQLNGTTEQINNETNQISGNTTSSESVNNGTDMHATNLQPENSKTLTDEEMQGIKGNGLVKVCDYYINRGKRNSVWVVVCKLNNPSIIFAGINLWGYYLTKAPGQPVKKYSFSNKYGIVSPVNPTWAFEFSRPYIIYGWAHANIFVFKWA